MFRGFIELLISSRHLCTSGWAKKTVHIASFHQCATLTEEPPYTVTMVLPLSSCFWPSLFSQPVLCHSSFLHAILVSQSFHFLPSSLHSSGRRRRGFHPVSGLISHPWGQIANFIPGPDTVAQKDGITKKLELWNELLFSTYSAITKKINFCV